MEAMPPQEELLYERLKIHLKARLVDLLPPANAGAAQGVDAGELTDQLRDMLGPILADLRGLALSAQDQDRLIHETLSEVLGFGPLDALLADETISEIMVNGPRDIFVERNGRIERVAATFTDAHHLMVAIERMLGGLGLTVTESSPVCDARLPDGSRINVIIPPLVLNGPVVTIRRKLRDWTMADYVAMGALSEQAAEFLEACVRARVNLVFSGATSTGKTTLVSVLSAAIPKGERLITIENVSELDLPGRDHWIRLVAKAANIEGKGEIPLRVLVKNALRMRPDRIILGEARGDEALDVVQAMHSGHDGFLTVLHANDATAALERLQMMMLMSGLEVPPSVCRSQIAGAVDLIIHMSRYADGSRRVAAITQVLGASDAGFLMEDVFVFEGGGFTSEGKLQGTCRYTGVVPKFLEKFALNNVPVPSWMATEGPQHQAASDKGQATRDKSSVGIRRSEVPGT